MGVFQIMDPVEGDITLRWDPDNKDEVEMARKSFEEYTREKPRGKGYKAYRMYDGDKQGEEMKTFDRFAERALFLPQIAGG